MVVVSEESIVTLQATDSVAGLDKIIYRLQKNNESLRSGDYENRPIRMKGLREGPYQLKIFAVDRVMNREPEKIYNMFVDLTPPQYKVSYSGPTSFNGKTRFLSSEAKIEITSTDNYSGVRETRAGFKEKVKASIAAPWPRCKLTGHFPWRSKAVIWLAISQI